MRPGRSYGGPAGPRTRTGRTPPRPRSPSSTQPKRRGGAPTPRLRVIAGRAVRLGKQAVLAADETPLAAGLDQERRLYELAMATDDRVEGMTAFIEKRRPEFRGR